MRDTISPMLDSSQPRSRSSLACDAGRMATTGTWLAWSTEALTRRLVRLATFALLSVVSWGGPQTSALAQEAMTWSTDEYARLSADMDAADASRVLTVEGTGDWRVATMAAINTRRLLISYILTAVRDGSMPLDLVEPALAARLLLIENVVVLLGELQECDQAAAAVRLLDEVDGSADEEIRDARVTALRAVGRCMEDARRGASTSPARRQSGSVQPSDPSVSGDENLDRERAASARNSPRHPPRSPEMPPDGGRPAQARTHSIAIGMGTGVGASTTEPNVYGDIVGTEPGLALSPLQFGLHVGFKLSALTELVPFARIQSVILDSGISVEPMVGLKIRYYTRNDPRNRIYLEAGTGYGDVSHLLYIEEVEAQDTTNEGPLHLGGGVGGILLLTENFGLNPSLYAMILAPRFSLHADITLSLFVQF
jgi:hypothetical protein